MRLHISGGGGNICGMPGEAHSVTEPLGEHDYWCSMCARIHNELKGQGK